MKSYHTSNNAGLASLTTKEHERLAPGPRELLVCVRATSLNARGLMILHGTLPEPVRPEVVPGSDGAGVVIATGRGVSRAAVGDRVTCSMMPHWIDGPLKWEYAPALGSSLDGSLTEYTLLPEEGVVPIPEHLSFKEVYDSTRCRSDRLECTDVGFSSAGWSNGTHMRIGRGFTLRLAICQTLRCSCHCHHIERRQGTTIEGTGSGRSDQLSDNPRMAYSRA